MTKGPMSFLRQYLAAIQLFTRVPVRGTLAQRAGSSPEMLRASVAHFPGVGWLAGLVACTAFALLGLGLPDNPFAPLVAAAGCTAATVWLTGGSHEGGLANVANGLGAGAGRADALDIMKAPHLRTGGMLALSLVLFAKVSLLSVLAAHSPTAVLAALLGAHVLSRFWPLVLMRTTPYVGADADGGLPLADRIDTRTLAVAAGWCLPPLAVVLFVQGAEFAVLALACSGLALGGMRWLFARSLEGYTRDCLGAAQQACELAFYLGAAVALGAA